jgi:hypothetical protein
MSAKGSTRAVLLVTASNTASFALSGSEEETRDTRASGLQQQMEEKQTQTFLLILLFFIFIVLNLIRMLNRPC